MLRNLRLRQKSGFLFFFFFLKKNVREIFKNTFLICTSVGCLSDYVHIGEHWYGRNVIVVFYIRNSIVKSGKTFTIIPISFRRVLLQYMVRVHFLIFFSCYYHFFSVFPKICRFPHVLQSKHSIY